MSTDPKHPLTLRFLDGPGTRKSPFAVHRRQVPERWPVFFAEIEDGEPVQKTAVYSLVDVIGDGTAGTYAHLATLDGIHYDVSKGTLSSQKANGVRITTTIGDTRLTE